jgi:sugar phosphate permease
MDTSESYREVLVALFSSPTIRFLIAGYLVVNFLGTGIAKWDAVFFRRAYGISTGELGSWLGFVALVALPAMYGGGYLASRYAPKDERLQLRAIGVVFAAYSISAVGVYIAPDYHVAFIFKALTVAGGFLVIAPTYALLQTLSPAHMRATSFAMLGMLSHLVAGGVGPTAVGALSDALRPVAGNESLRIALIASCPGFLIGGWCYWRAAKTVMADIAHGR